MDTLVSIAKEVETCNEGWVEKEIDQVVPATIPADLYHTGPHVNTFIGLIPGRSNNVDVEQRSAKEVRMWLDKPYVVCFCPPKKPSTKVVTIEIMNVENNDSHVVVQKYFRYSVFSILTRTNSRLATKDENDTRSEIDDLGGNTKSVPILVVRAPELSYKLAPILVKAKKPTKPWKLSQLIRPTLLRGQGKR